MGDNVKTTDTVELFYLDLKEQSQKSTDRLTTAAFL